MAKKKYKSSAIKKNKHNIHAEKTNDLMFRGVPFAKKIKKKVSNAFPTVGFGKTMQKLITNKNKNK